MIDLDDKNTYDKITGFFIQFERNDFTKHKVAERLQKAQNGPSKSGLSSIQKL